MPAYASRKDMVRPRERAYALAAVVFVQLTLGAVLLSGFRVEVRRPVEIVQHLIDITIPKPPPIVPVQPPPKPREYRAAAPKVAPAPLGGSLGPQPAHAPPSVKPIVALQPSAAPSGGGTGSGPAAGSGAGGGTGGNGAGDGGTDLEQISGEINSADYPRDLREAGIGGRVSFVFTVEPNGRVGRCTVTRSSGVPELDSLTCRLIQQRFVYRPSTARNGRPIADEVEGEHEWIARGR